MEEKLQIIKIYERLYFILSMTYFFLTAAIIFFIIDGYLREKDASNSTFFVCIMGGIMVLLVSILCGILSLKNWKLIKKSNTLSIEDVFGLSLASLLLLCFPLAVYSYGWFQSSSRWISGSIVVFFSIFLTVMNTIVIVSYFTPSVREIRLSLENVQRQGEKNG